MKAAAEIYASNEPHLLMRSMKQRGEYRDNEIKPAKRVLSRRIEKRQIASAFFKALAVIHFKPELFRRTHIKNIRLLFIL
jgi:hypothetical protein